MVVLYLIDKGIVSSQIITQLSCASFGAVPVDDFKPNLVREFDFSELKTNEMNFWGEETYSGQWFMHQQYDWPQSVNYDCYVQIRTPRPDGNQNITELLVKPGALLKNFQSDGITTFDLATKGHYIYTNPTHPSWGSTPHFILGTDYVTYAIEFSCEPVTDGNQVYVYVLSRAPVVTFVTQNEIDDILKRFHITKTGTWRTLNITSCPSQLLNVAGGPGLLERVLQIVGTLVGGVVTVVGGLLGGLGGLLG